MIGVLDPRLLAESPCRYRHHPKAKKPALILHVQSPLAATIGSVLLERLLDKRAYIWDENAMLRAVDEIGDELTGQISGVDAETFQAILRDVVAQIKSQMPALEHAFWSSCRASTAWASLVFSEIAASEKALVAWKKKAPTLKEALLRRLTKDKGHSAEWLSRLRAVSVITLPIRFALDSIGNTVASNIRLNLPIQSLWGYEDLCGSRTLERLAKARWLTNPAIRRGTMNRPALFHAIESMVSQAGHVSMTPIGNAVAISDRPTEIHLDSRQRPHRLDGPAMLYRDGWAIYAVHGVVVPREVIEQPSSITVERIEGETNIEVRRAMIERYGLDRYMKDSQTELLHQDATGLLYRKQVANDEAIVMVRVLNSTPEPDGTLSRDEALGIFGEMAHAALHAPANARFKEYTIRVPPNMTTAHEAVAWTFGLTAEDYHPALET